MPITKKHSKQLATPVNQVAKATIADLQKAIAPNSITHASNIGDILRSLKDQSIKVQTDELRRVKAFLKIKGINVSGFLNNPMESLIEVCAKINSNKRPHTDSQSSTTTSVKKQAIGNFQPISIVNEPIQYESSLATTPTLLDNSSTTTRKVANFAPIIYAGPKYRNLRLSTTTATKTYVPQVTEQEHRLQIKNKFDAEVLQMSTEVDKNAIEYAKKVRALYALNSEIKTMCETFNQSFKDLLIKVGKSQEEIAEHANRNPQQITAECIKNLYILNDLLDPANLSVPTNRASAAPSAP